MQKELGGCWTWLLGWLTLPSVFWGPADALHLDEDSFGERVTLTRNCPLEYPCFPSSEEFEHNLVPECFPRESAPAQRKSP